MVPWLFLRDYGREYTGIPLGDASAAPGVVKRHGLGRFRDVDVGMLWVQQKHGDRILENQNVRDASNRSDGQTKFVGKDLVNYYATLCGCLFPDGKNEYGYTTNQLSYVGCTTSVDGMLGVHASSPNVAQDVADLCKRCGREDFRVWSRCDLASGTLKSTSTNGPCWSQVIGRVSVLNDTQDIIGTQRTDEILRSQEHAKLVEGNSDLVTYLLYVDDRWNSRGRRG